MILTVHGFTDENKAEDGDGCEGVETDHGQTEDQEAAHLASKISKQPAAKGQVSLLNSEKLSKVYCASMIYKQ